MEKSNAYQQGDEETCLQIRGLRKSPKPDQNHKGNRRKGHQPTLYVLVHCFPLVHGQGRRLVKMRFLSGTALRGRRAQAVFQRDVRAAAT